MNKENISIHAPPRGATRERDVHGDAEDFNSRPSARGDALPQSISVKHLHISIHAPPRGATTHAPCASLCHIISIHAPPRGATRQAAQQQQERNISIHAPPRGATTPLLTFRRGAAHFNSRPSARGDGTVSKSALCVMRFQFTPLREGRRQSQRWTGFCHDFNSRPSARGDAVSIRAGCTSSASVFQFTPLREGRL